MVLSPNLFDISPKLFWFLVSLSTIYKCDVRHIILQFLKGNTGSKANPGPSVNHNKRSPIMGQQMQKLINQIHGLNFLNFYIMIQLGKITKILICWVYNDFWDIFFDLVINKLIDLVIFSLIWWSMNYLIWWYFY